MPAPLRFLLLQVRNADDPMRGQEVSCFARTLGVENEQIAVIDALSAAPTRRELDAVDMVLLGGSGDYSVTGSGQWLDRTLDAMRDIHHLAKPTFASCWGFQAFAKATGGEVVCDPSRAEIGTSPLRLTAAGKEDPVFGPLEDRFFGQMGHQDRVAELPPGTTLLASSEKVINQAYRFDGRPIYCTQFHPELNAQAMRERLATYPHYVEEIAGVSWEKFESTLRDTPETAAVLPRLLAHVFGPQYA